MRALLSEYIYENRILLSIRIPLILLRIRILLREEEERWRSEVFGNASHGPSDPLECPHLNGQGKGRS